MQRRMFRGSQFWFFEWQQVSPLVTVFALQFCTVPMLLSLSVTPIRTISVGVNSACDGMSEKLCFLYLHWASFITCASVRLIWMHLPLIRELQESLIPEEGRRSLATGSTTSPWSQLSS